MPPEITDAELDAMQARCDAAKTRTLLLTLALPEWYAEDWTQAQADTYYHGDMNALVMGDAPIVSSSVRLIWLYGDQDGTGVEEARAVIVSANVVPFEPVHGEEEDERLTEWAQEREDNAAYLRDALRFEREANRQTEARLQEVHKDAWEAVTEAAGLWSWAANLEHEGKLTSADMPEMGPMLAEHREWVKALERVADGLSDLLVALWGDGSFKNHLASGVAERFTEKMAALAALAAKGADHA